MQLNDLNNTVELKLTAWQKQIVYGTLLGNGHLARPKGSRNYHMVIRQPKRQCMEWFAYKVAELKVFGRRKAIQEDKYNWIWTSVSHPCWAEFYDICYKDHRKQVSIEWLDIIQDTSLMVMFCDKGKLDKKTNLASLKVGHLGKDFKVTEKYFCEYYKTPCRLSGTTLKFDELGTQKLVATIQHRLPVYMRHILNLT